MALLPGRCDCCAFIKTSEAIPGRYVAIILDAVNAEYQRRTGWPARRADVELTSDGKWIELDAVVFDGGEFKCSGQPVVLNPGEISGVKPYK